MPKYISSGLEPSGSSQMTILNGSWKWTPRKWTPKFRYTNVTEDYQEELLLLISTLRGFTKRQGLLPLVEIILSSPTIS